jgi:hypothetical protein
MWLRLLVGTAVLVSVGPARADRAVGPIDRLAPWTVELGSGLRWQDRSVTVESAGRTWQGEGFELGATPRLRVWLTDWLDLEVRQPISLGHSGDDEAGDDQALRDIELDSSVVVRRGALVGGTSLSLVLPTGGAGFSTERLAATAAVLAGVEIVPQGHLFARPSYTVRSGDVLSEAGDVIRGELGFAQRLGLVSLVPSAAVERTLRLTHLGDEIEGAFTTWRAAAEAAIEPVSDLTASLRLEWASAGQHDIGGGEAGRASEVAIGAALSFAWDLGVRRDRARPIPDPAAIRLAEVRIDHHPASANRIRELRHLIPRLRLATLAAERAAGGAHGEMVVLASRARGGPGSPLNVEVDDRVGSPGLARAVAEYYQRSMPDWAREVDRLEITLCFERCSAVP